MSGAELAAAIRASLAPLAAARETVMADPDACPPANTDACPTCGGPFRHWRAWRTLTERCRADWHTGAPLTGSAT